MTEKTNEASVPYGFKKHLETEHYAVYENQYMLPFVKTADAIYSESELDRLPALAKEQAILGLFGGNVRLGDQIGRFWCLLRFS